MAINKIYFDMDGVLADFDRGVEELLGLPALKQDDKKPEQDDELYDKMRQLGHFYDKLKPMPGAVELLNQCWAKYGDKCEILSGVPKERRGIVDAREDKINWMKRMFDFDIKVNLVYSENKKDYAHGKEDVLVDDYERNIKQWIEAGGTGILFTDAEDAWKKLQELG